MILNQREQQRAKFALRHWCYYKKNSQELSFYEKINALNLFKGLKQLKKDEIKLLAERYYKSVEVARFDSRVGNFKTVVPVPYKVIADKFKRHQRDVQEELKQIERKLGALIVGYVDQAEQKGTGKTIDRFNGREKRVIGAECSLNNAEIRKQARTILKSYQPKLRAGRIDEATAIKNAVSQLNDTYKAVLTARYLAKTPKTVVSLAVELGYSYKTVEKWVADATMQFAEDYDGKQTKVADFRYCFE